MIFACQPQYNKYFQLMMMPKSHSANPTAHYEKHRPDGANGKPPSHRLKLAGSREALCPFGHRIWGGGGWQLGVGHGQGWLEFCPGSCIIQNRPSKPLLLSVVLNLYTKVANTVSICPGAGWCWHLNDCAAAKAKKHPLLRTTVLSE